ncbi:MAG TPA: hypothetical protein H9755_07425 [Candidatus Dietzia intestinigallinarum]|nr:hypothetical protein [Candidatus Dietzia intestinigallinarum]
MAAAAESKEIELDETEVLAAETAQAARLIVASYSKDAEECRMLLDMLGIGPETVDPEDAE